MPKSRLFAVFILFIWSNVAVASFEFTGNCQQAYQKASFLKLNEARAYILLEKRSNPNNALIHLLENYVDYYTIFSGDKLADLDVLEENKDKRLALLSKEQMSSPYYLYTQAEINFQWALCHFKFQQYLSGALEINKAFTLFTELKQKFPDFLPANKGLGVLHIMLDVVPPSIKKTLSAFGLKGNAAYGVKLLETILNQPAESKYAYLYDETAFLYAYIGIDFFKNAPNKIQQYVQQMHDENLLKTFIKSQVELRTGYNNQAITTLQTRSQSAVYAPFYMLDYYLGVSKLNRQDDDAHIYLERFIAKYEGYFYVKDAYLRLGWYYLLKGNTAKYRECINFVKTRGEALAEKDKQALVEANRTDLPNLFLLAARVVYDGGYYEKAATFLKDKKAESFSTTSDKLEFTYRLGRIYQGLKKYDLAIQYYESTIAQGADSKVYYVPNAALQLGIIFEERKNTAQAKYYYELCLSLKGHEYKTALDTKAKAGLLRIEAKN